MRRRNFIRQSIAGSFVMATGSFPLNAFSSDPHLTKLTILHTNDVHSRIDPFPMDGGRNQGLGGASKRAALIRKIRAEEKNVLLFDSGDIFQGTPYFNFFNGELEIKLMSEMAYDAGTIGNHDFDAGIDGFDTQLVHADFPFVISNYDFRNTVLKGKTKPYTIIQKGDIKIGVFGLGIELDGLVPKALYGDTVYLDPLQYAQRTADILTHDLHCDYVVCLSHLGYAYSENRISDIIIAQNTNGIDLILGGHTHTFMRKPDIRRNNKGNEVIVSQAGWAGIMLGRLDIFFEKGRKKKCVTCKNTLIR